MKPKYHVGDTLYRKDTKKKATILEIKYVTFAPSMDFQPDYPILCYILSEPINFKEMWSDIYISVEIVDKDENYCDFKVSGEPKYHAGDKIECLKTGRVVRIDLVSAGKNFGKPPYKYHVTPWLFHQNEDGYHWCEHIDGNVFIQKTDKEVSTDKPKYKVGDLLKYQSNDNPPRFFLISKIEGNKFYGFHESAITINGELITRLDNNKNYSLASEKEKQEWIENQGEFHKGEYIIHKGVGYRIDGKSILIENEKAAVYYSIDKEYNNFTFLIEDGDKEFRREFPKYECSCMTGHNDLGDTIINETKEAYINRKAMEFYLMTFKHYMEKGGDDIKQVTEIASKAADEFKIKFGIGIKPIPPEFDKVIEENFWNLF